MAHRLIGILRKLARVFSQITFKDGDITVRGYVYVLRAYEAPDTATSTESENLHLEGRQLDLQVSPIWYLLDGRLWSWHPRIYSLITLQTLAWCGTEGESRSAGELGTDHLSALFNRSKWEKESCLGPRH